VAEVEIVPKRNENAEENADPIVVIVVKNDKITTRRMGH